MPYRGEDHRCVSCGEKLKAERAYEKCPKCGGIWIAEPALLALLRTSPDAAQQDELMVHNDGTPRRPCPQCGREMEIAWLDLLQLDRCELDGVWLDAGELYKALRGKALTPEALLRALAPQTKKS